MYKHSIDGEELWLSSKIIYDESAVYDNVLATKKLSELAAGPYFGVALKVYRNCANRICTFLG